MKNTLKNLSYEEMQNWASAQGLKAFVGKQIFEWLFDKKVSAASEMLNIKKEVRDLVDRSGAINLLKNESHELSADDGSEKFLFRCLDGEALETVLIRSPQRSTLCISSQIGCAMGCSFCRTSGMGLIRNLSSGEMLEQFIQVSRMSRDTITNVVFMGMGEPFDNYEQAIKAAVVLNHEKGPNIVARRITLSTAGIVPRIRDFARLPYQFRLAVSLNAADNAKRDALMPINRRYPVEELLQAAKYYTDISNRHITFEYVLIRGVNDSPADAAELRKKLTPFPVN
ncbi:MAG: 23S rRNA (adenine(2503)-C(2))-methyltransferase RlmN [Candidatus Marinimicrobia bacterium]|nr:23S rRNA (adenine(2503)-C(2))-methyltransferase RlmN [Candidatus Neomarinimicrobiota bacterium]